MLITLRNDFHNTETRVRIAHLPGTLSTEQVRRATRKLCGLHDCTCGGIRGPQHHDGLRLHIFADTAEYYAVEID